MAQKKSMLDTRNLVNPEELSSIIKLQLKTIWSDPKAVKTVPPLLIWGSPGCGKSSIVSGVCEELGIEFLDQRLAQMEPCDIKGLPVPNKEDKVMDWYVNGSWPRNPKGKGIIFLDEITAADRSIQVAAYELVLDRRLGKLYNVPDGYLIVAAGNTVTDHAVATTMSSALANRFMHVELQADQENWLSWARHNDIHPSVIGFIQYKPDALFKMEDENLERGWPSPRAWERVSRMCHDCPSKDLLRKMVYGLVGNGYGAEFMAFHELNAEFDNILDIMRDPNSKIKIPERADQKFAMCSAMVYLVWRGKDEKDAAARLTGFYRICIELSSDFASMALLAAMEGKDKNLNKQYADALISHPLFPKWRAKHKDALQKHMKKFSSLSS